MWRKLSPRKDLKMKGYIWLTLIILLSVGVVAGVIAGLSIEFKTPDLPSKTPAFKVTQGERDWGEYWDRVSQFHWLDKPSLCVLPGQSIREVVNWIADKGQEEQGRLVLAIANGVDPDLRWPRGACFTTPKELVNGLVLPDQLEGIGALTEGHCPDEYITLLRRMVTAGDIDVPRFRWFYPDSRAAIQPGQVPARAMPPGQIIFIPGAPR